RAVQGHSFPAKLTDTTRAYFTATAKTAAPDVAAAMRRLIADPADAAADAIVSRDDGFRSTLRTCCVATLLSAGHAEHVDGRHRRGFPKGGGDPGVRRPRHLQRPRDQRRSRPERAHPSPFAV
ncbi:MAG TPA: hypothetical protein VF695_08020, partial [Sphingomonas sp.]